MTENTVKLN